MLLGVVMACGGLSAWGVRDGGSGRLPDHATGGGILTTDHVVVPEGTSPPGETSPTYPVELAARLGADVVAGDFPLVVSFSTAGSELGAGTVAYEWAFGDGAVAVGGPDAVHTYVGEGEFVATVTLVDGTGASSAAELPIEVWRPSCPEAAPPLGWGTVEDASLTELSGLVASRRDPEAYWVHEDSGQEPVLVALDASGGTLSTQQLPDELSDPEDLAIAIDPETGVSTLFLGDIGDNGRSRDEVEVWVLDEPDPRVEGAPVPLQLRLAYPDGARDAETLLVDPRTFDLYLVTKESEGPASVYVKRAPHDAEGPFVLEALGERSALDLIATGGDVSPDGSQVVVRDYTATARLWIRDGYLPLEDAFDGSACELGLAGEQQGEAIGFTSDGLGVVTVSEGGNQPLNYVGL